MLGFFIGGLYISALEITKVAPEYQKAIMSIWKQTKVELATSGVDTTEKVKLAEVRVIISYIFDNFRETVLTTILVIGYIVLALPEVTSWRSKIRGCLGKERGMHIIETSEELGKSFQKYLAAMTICGVINGVATLGVAYLLGLDLIFTQGILAFLLNFIPIVGAAITVIIPVGIAFIQFDGMMPLVVLLCMGSLHAFLGNIVEPKIQGNMLSMSPLIVLISLSVWGFLWGVPGAYSCSPAHARYHHCL